MLWAGQLIGQQVYAILGKVLSPKVSGFERQFTACEARKNIRGQGPCAQITVGISIHHTLDKKLPFAGGLISVAI